MEPITDLKKGTIVELLLNENIEGFTRKRLDDRMCSPWRAFEGENPSMVLNSGSAVGYVFGVNEEIIELCPLIMKKGYDSKEIDEINQKSIDKIQYEWGTIMDLRVLE